MFIETSTRDTSSATAFPALRFTAKIISHLFHPLFVSLYISYYLIFVNGTFFTGFSHSMKTHVMVWVFINMFLFPSISVLLLKAVGFIDSIYLYTQKDRIIPYITANLFYFWMYLVFHNNTSIPLIITSFVLGVFLTSSAGLLANIYFKISMHGLGMGGATGIFLVMIYFCGSSGITVPLMITLLLRGIVLSSRIIGEHHTNKELYSGFIVGILIQLIAAKCLF